MNTLDYFAHQPFVAALKTFFDDLNIPLSHIADEPVAANEILESKYKPKDEAHALIDEIYPLGALDDAAFERASTPAALEAVREKKTDYDGVLIFGVSLKPRDNGLLPTRGQMAEITRAFNRAFHFTPIVIVFRYAAQENTFIAFANCERSAYAQSWREGEKAGKVSILRDIDVRQTHAGHLRILQQLQINPLVINSFQTLYDYWRGVLDVSTLNKKFYAELSNWFFAAQQFAKFPDKADHAIERGLIRLITRLIFTWFIKERGLVPEQLFEPKYLKTLLKNSKADSDSYYRAVLQNLFFATLNSEMDERRFCEDSGGKFGQKGDYAINCFRYAEEFQDQNIWRALVERVPFLNGGLFECLDHSGKEGEYIDGFSRERKNQAKLTNDLFWGDGWQSDLSDAFGDSKPRLVQITPLLNLLHSYKFTIDENTPLEEDVALDPELLGKVFENLLASYNPETRTTARKQTGSFYTPREIVNYMVEESLRAYLEPTAQNTTTADGTDALRVLLSDADARNAKELGLPEEQIKALVKAIERCTILDPACGSGAFPMGALSKMVALLKKLDPDNNLWRETQLHRVANELGAHAAQPDAKEKAQQETAKIFNDNNADYTRKLFLIENCLFGVDIQPVALQITKLRCFIALIIDQKIAWDKPKENFNVRALPNLETKFVAANTLISPENQLTLTWPELDQLIVERDGIRRAHISPQSRKEKKWMEQEDKRLTLAIEQEVVSNNFDKSYAVAFTTWNPYDQNASCPFFAPLSMFGPKLRNGFDVVIGNPPYVQVKKGYVSAEKFPFAEGKDKGKQNLYKVFVEAGYNLASTPSENSAGGIVCMITQSSIMCDISARFTREMLLKQTELSFVVEFPKIAPTREGQVFEAVLQGTCVLLFRKTEKFDATHEFGISINNDVTTIEKLKWDTLPQGELFAMYPVGAYIPLVHPGERAIIEKMTLGIPRLFSLRVENSQGDLNLTGDKDSYGERATPVKLYRGRNVHRYWIETDMQEFVTASFRKDSQKLNNENPYLLCQNITGTVDEWRLHFALAEPGSRYLCGHTVNKVRLKEGDKSKFVLGVLNSKVMDWFFRKTSTNNHVNSYELDELPIPASTPEEQGVLSGLVEQILAAKAEDAAADVSTLERAIDELVADLYGLDAEEKQLVGLR